MKLSGSTKKLFIRVVLFLLYIVLGAAIFVALEKNKEALERKKAKDFVNRRVRFNVSFNNSEDLKNFLLEFQRALHYGYNIESQNFKGEKWTYLNAFYFVGNIVTTIGFGHMSPETDGGRLFCIVFALFGIPLTALMLRSVGNRISEWIIIMIKQFDRRVYNREAENAELKSAVIAFCLLWSIILLPAIAFSKIEKDWGYLGSVYYCFVTFSTIGFGDLVPTALREPSKVESQVFVEFSDLLYLVIGLAIMSSVVVAISGVIENKTQMLVDPMEAFRRIDMDNLNSVAVKKLGLKINRPDNLNVRNGTEAQKANDIPNGATNRRGVKFPNWYHQRLQERHSSDRIDHVGPAPVISIAKQKTSRSNDNSRSMVNGTLVKTENLETIVTVKADSSISCHSTSPLPPPVFKSNKVTPTEDMPVGTKNGMVNGTFETLDELAVQTTEADFESDNEASKISELMNVSSASEEYELRNESEIMNLKTDVSFKVEKA